MDKLVIDHNELESIRKKLCVLTGIQVNIDTHTNYYKVQNLLRFITTDKKGEDICCLYNVSNSNVVIGHCIGQFDKNLVRVRDLNNNIGYINRDCEVVIPIIYKTADLFMSNGTVMVENFQGNWGILNTLNKVILPLHYQDITHLYRNYFRVTNKRLSGVFHIKKGFILPVEYEYLSIVESYSDNKRWLCAIKDNKAFYHDMDGNIIPFD